MTTNTTGYTSENLIEDFEAGKRLTVRQAAMALGFSGESAELRRFIDDGLVHIRLGRVSYTTKEALAALLRNLAAKAQAAPSN